MSKVYKVWLQVEEIDEENDVYENIDLPTSVGGEFATLEKADAFLNKLAFYADDLITVL